MNYSGQDLVNAFHETRRDLQESDRKLVSLGIAMCSAGREYRIAVSKMILRLRAERQVPWTVCGDLARGMESVEALLFSRDVSEVRYNNEISHNNNLKLEAKFLENEINAGLKGGRNG